MYIEAQHLSKAKDILTGEWVEGYYVSLPGVDTDEFISVIFTEDCRYEGPGIYTIHGCHKVDKNTVCVATWLKDKNHTYLFEHDLVKTSKGEIAEVVSWNPSPRYQNSFALAYKGGLDMCIDGVNEIHTCEYIGNIFDNPDIN